MGVGGGDGMLRAMYCVTFITSSNRKDVIKDFTLDLSTAIGKASQVFEVSFRRAECDLTTSRGRYHSPLYLDTSVEIRQGITMSNTSTGLTGDAYTRARTTKLTRGGGRTVGSPLSCQTPPLGMSLLPTHKTSTLMDHLHESPAYIVTGDFQ